MKFWCLQETLNEHLVMVRRSLEGLIPPHPRPKPPPPHPVTAHEAHEPASGLETALADATTASASTVTSGAASPAANGVTSGAASGVISDVAGGATRGAVGGAYYPASPTQGTPAREPASAVPATAGAPTTTVAALSTAAASEATAAAAAASNQERTTLCAPHGPTLNASGLLPPKPQPHSKPPRHDAIRVTPQASWKSRNSSMNSNTSSRHSVPGVSTVFPPPVETTELAGQGDDPSHANLGQGPALTASSRQHSGISHASSSVNLEDSAEVRQQYSECAAEQPCSSAARSEHAEYNAEQQFSTCHNEVSGHHESPGRDEQHTAEQPRSSSAPNEHSVYNAEQQPLGHNELANGAAPKQHAEYNAEQPFSAGHNEISGHNENTEQQQFSDSIPVQAPLALPTLEDRDASTLPVDHFPLMQGQGDLLFNVVVAAQEQLRSGQKKNQIKAKQRTSSKFFDFPASTSSRTPSRQPSRHLALSEDEFSAFSGQFSTQTSSAVQLRGGLGVGGSPSGVSPTSTNALNTALNHAFGTAFGTPTERDSAQVPLLGGESAAKCAPIYTALLRMLLISTA